VKKENKKQRTVPRFYLFIILITIIIFIIPTKTISAAPLTYIPLDSWVYPAISRLETLQAFSGNDTVATNTLPLIRIEAAYLIDTALSNVQRGKIEFKDSDLTLMEKLVLEFQDELTSIDVKVISINSDTDSSATAATHSSDSRLYESLNYFAQQENFFSSNLSLSLLNPQMSRKDMAILLDEIIYQLQTEQIPLSNLTDQDIEKLETLIIELNDELSSQGLKIVRLNKTTVILDNLKSTLKIADINYLLDSNLTNLINTQINQAYLTLRFPSFEIPTPSNTPFFPSLTSIEFPALDLQVGRDCMKWGPGYQGNLVLSDNPPAFDMIKYSGTFDLNELGEGLGSVNFTKFFSLLDTLEDENRYFSGQRLEYKPFDTLTLGLSETAIISYNSSLLFFNPLPFIPPYYVTRWIADVLEQPSEINSYVGVDMELNFHPGIKLYGEWMADDFIFRTKTNPYPNRTGFLAGAYFADPLGRSDTDFRIEYTHINNYVYFSTHLWQDYLYQGEYIANPLGPDADQLYLELTHRLSDKFNLSLNYTHERHGEGQVGIPLPSDPIIANENIFLSGIIEKQQAYQAEISYTMSPRWELSASATLENIENKDNTVGENENNTYFQLELNYQW